ncbi:tape measure protein [Phocaeicola vulgatus]|jgi:tape measure domain-containing protein|uniref:Tape measure protein n=2 Tax=Phocaeicola vulgatus TaxID=821 RepID=A0A6I0HM36_PHOVU|nr:tape measure protein [Phocaeicola vulgatus]KAB3870845.1 tape measure protein [Phocaeicola vulgatus]KAB3871947.1 tape measure protein [Phocaeicola vulgatus]KAB3877274.1 tape measure protein [Phocaeicola vulgatus]KAB3882875.1 tape measure protein [Phocaeicola vulgatus]
MAGIHFDITGDNSNFLRRLREVENGVKNTSKQIEQSGLGIEELFNRMTRAAAAFGAGFTAKELISNIAQVRGEFQQLEVAFKTMLGSEDKANALMQQLVKTAATTPFDLQGVANGAKQLLAYGENVENVNDDLIRLGNIAAGLSQPLGDIVYLYGTTMTQGRLYTADLNQFTGRGIPMIRELAKVFGVAENEVRGLVEAGKVGFPEVQKVIQNLTNEGGMFYNLMQEQSKTITGQISNIEDAVSTMFNEIGKANEGIINEALSGVSYLVENYEKVGKVLVGLVATYGVYKVAVMTVTALQALQASGIAALTIAERAHYGWLVLQTTAQKALNAVMLTNPYVLLATAVVGLGAAMWTFHDSTTESEKALDRFNKKQEEAQKLEQEHKQKIDSLVQSSRDIALSDLQRGQSLAELRKEYPKIFEQYDIESIKLADILKLKQQIAAEDTKRAGEKQEKELSDIEAEIKYYENLLKSLSGQQGIDGYVKKLKDLRADRDVLLQEKGKGISEQFISGLNNIDISKFDRYIAELEKRIKGKGENGKIKLRLPIDVKGSLSDEAIYDVKDIQTLIDTAKSKKQSRIDEEKNKTTYQEDLANAKVEWEKAKKGYEALIKDQTATSKQVKEAKDKMEASEKTYKELGGVTGSALTRQENLAKKQKENQEKLDGQLLSLHRQNQQDEINLMREGTEKKLKQIDLDYQKQIDAIRKQEEEWSKAGNGKLTDKQVREISEAYANAESMRDKDITNVTKEQLKAEQQALNDYLKEYGTFQQQKLAIAQEYSEKIRKAQEESGANSAQVKLLEKQRDVAIQNKETEAIKANIDWVTVFGEFGSMFSDMVKPALDEAKKYIQTDKFKNSDQASQKSLIDAISQMEKSLGGTSGVNFKKLGEDVKAYHRAEQNRINAVGIETDALEKLQKAQEDYAKAQKDGTESEKQAAANALETAQQNADIASANVKTQTDIANQAQRNMTDTATRLKTSMENLLGGLQQISSGGLYNAYSGIIKTVNGFKDVIGKTSESLQEVPIVGWILSIIDVLKDGLSDLVGGLLDAVLNAVSGIISDVLSGDLFVTIGNSLKNGIGNILNAISFGGFNSLFGIGGNKKEVEEAINRLTDRNETLQTAIEDLTDEMKASKGTQSVAAYRDAYKYQKETIDNYKRIAQEQARYSGSHHSWNYYWGGFSQEQIDRLSGKIGRDWNGDIWNLTPEEMKMLRETVDMWETIQNTGKGGYGDRLTDKLNDYIDQAGTLEELTNELYEGLTGMSFDSMYDSFVDNLMDMKYDAKAASEDISEYFMRAMLSNKIGELYSEKLEEWWEKFGASMEDNELTEEERKALQDEYMKYVDEAMKLRDELAAATGYDKISQESYSQSSSSRGFGTEMTHEDAGELSGRFTALQVSNEEIKSQMINVVVGIGSLISISTEGNATLGNILNQHVITNGYLEDIVKYTKPILELGSKLDKIVDNTKNM